MADASGGMTKRIMTGMALGLATGLVLHALGPSPRIDAWLVGGLFDAGGRIFIALLKLLVVPLVFVSLVVGTASLDDVRKLGRVGAKTLGLYLATTAAAVALALGAATALSPGAGFHLSASGGYEAKTPPPLADTLVNIVPANPVKAMAEGEMLQIIFFGILFGAALVLSGEAGARVAAVFKDLDAVVNRMVTMLIGAAPYGVFCLIAKVFAQQGFGAAGPIARYFFVVLLVLALHAGVVYPLLLKALAGLDPLRFMRKFKAVPVFAFSTSSSNATVPVTLETVVRELGVSEGVASFVIPLGATINMDGTAIMQGVATVFIAQAYGLELGLQGCLTVVLTATLASVGTAGVPSVGLVTLAMVLRQVNLPVEGIALIIGVDRLLDMARTVVNVTGDAVVSCIVARSEGQLDQRVFDAG